jgi:hypothetical protein
VLVTSGSEVLWFPTIPRKPWGFPENLSDNLVNTDTLRLALGASSLFPSKLIELFSQLHRKCLTYVP